MSKDHQIPPGGDETKREKEDFFALVPTAPVGVEKRDQDTHFTDFGMVAETMALTKSPLPTDRPKQRINDLTCNPLQTRALRIVIVNDEQGPLKCFEVAVRVSLKHVTLLLFQNSSDAWQELSQTDPDLLITNYRMPILSGGEILQRLLGRNATYPIIVVSPYMRTEWLMRVQECASRGLNVTFLQLPFSITDFRTRLQTSLKTPETGRPLGP